MKKLILIAAALFCMVSSAQAVPVLQLDIAGGTYVYKNDINDPGTIVAPSNSFTLYALLNDSSLLGRDFFISAALTPQTAPPGTNAGSFSFNGTTVNVTGDMLYGVPPVESNLAQDPNDLPQHGVFETYFKEFKFNFNDSQEMSRYDSQLRAINGGTIPTGGSGLHWMAFTIDTALLNPGYGIHFDLYSEKISGGDIDIKYKAPFSHDAETGPPVPEPGTMVLLSLGLVGLAIYGKRRANKA